jgi:hypothetical protein
MSTNEKLYTYYGFSLIDITPTGVTSFSQEKERERNQQRNWETVNQILSLRTQLLDLQYMGNLVADVSNYSFGINYTGQHKIWQFKFKVEYEDVYASTNDRYGGLKQDLKIIPIILNLDETAKPDIALFYTSGPFKNMYFKSVLET